MKYHAKKFDRYNYEWDTNRNRDRIADTRKRLAEHDSDERKVQRLDACECRVCFYLCRPRIGGAACSERPCGLCGYRITSGNTDVNVLCKSCGHERGLCAHCGGDLDGKCRRKVDLEFREFNPFPN